MYFGDNDGVELTVNCGFKPDVVFFGITDDSQDNIVTQYDVWYTALPYVANENVIAMEATNTGFRIHDSIDYPYSDRMDIYMYSCTLFYMAIKFS